MAIRRIVPDEGNSRKSSRPVSEPLGDRLDYTIVRWGLLALAPPKRRGLSGVVVVCRTCRAVMRGYTSARLCLAKHLRLTDAELLRIDVLTERYVAEIKPWRRKMRVAAGEIMDFETRMAVLEDLRAERPESPFEHGFGPILFVRLEPGEKVWIPTPALVPDVLPWEGGECFETGEDDEGGAA